MTLADVAPAPNLAPATETGALGLYQLKRLWSRSMAARAGRYLPTTLHDRHLDHLVIHASGLGLEQTASFLGQEAPSFEEFERWIVATTGGVAPERVARINATVVDDDIPQDSARWIAAVEASAPVLDSSDLACWQQHGYVVVHDAVTPATREAAAHALWRHLDATPDGPETWYRPNDHGIMVRYFQHPAFEAVRRPPRIHKAFAQGAGDLVIWHQALPHSASPNRGTRPRMVQYVNMF